MSVFLDSSVLVAYYNERDEHHRRAVELLKRVFDNEYGHAYMSDYILNESVTVAWIRTKNKEVAVKLGERLLYSELRMLNVTDDIVEHAWELYKKFDNPSFTDTTIIALMRENEIENIATFDKWFKGVKGVNVLSE